MPWTVTAILIGCTLVAGQQRRNAERMTTPDRKTLLGFQVDPTTFQSCEGKKIPISGGKVEPTKEPCPGPDDDPWRPIVGGRPITGVLRELNPTARTFKIEAGGEVFTWFVPQTKQNEINFGTLKRDSSVTVTGVQPKAGGGALLYRAERIQIRPEG